MTCPTTTRACECVRGSIRQRECIAIAHDVVRNMQHGGEATAATARKVERRLQALDEA